MSEFNVLLEAKIPSLIRYASALVRDRKQAIDLVEETMIEIRDRVGERPHGTDLRVWLLTVLHELRSNPFRLADPTAKAIETAVDAGAQLTLSDLNRALARLPEAQRAVILLIGLEGTSYRETSTILGISEGTMRSRLTRGRESLRRAMGIADEFRPSQAA